jgi:hypothetical protein
MPFANLSRLAFAHHSTNATDQRATSAASSVICWI